MIRLPIKSRTFAMIAVIVPLLILFIYVALRSGPLAPVLVTVTTVENKAIAPAIFGIGTLEARYTYKIGPTVAGRVKQVNVNVGDFVHAGQLLGEMEDKLKELVSQYKNLESQRNNLVDDLRRLANETLDRAERARSSARDFSADEHLTFARREVKKSNVPAENSPKRLRTEIPASVVQKAPMAQEPLRSFFDEVA